MKRFALNFICKDEEHVIDKMLTSALPVTDLIVALDTGSKDRTIQLIYTFGRTNNIPTYVFERPFDSFCNSRNYALEKLKEVIKDLQWDPELTWWFFVDCDEILEFSEQFSKQSIVNDFYCSCITDGTLLHPRQFLFKLSKGFHWEGPIHEYIKDCESTTSVGYLKNIRTVCRPVGASWKGNIEKKYLNYAQKLIEYVNEGNRTFRWLNFIGESFYTAADACKSKQGRRQWLLQALNYYEQAAEIGFENRFELYIVSFRIGKTKLNLGYESNEVRETFLKAYAADQRHAEPLYEIIKFYTKKGQWEAAYLFSTFAISNYHGKLPTGSDIGDIILCIYEWELLFYHLLICSNSGRIGESKRYYLQLKAILKEHTANLNGTEMILIRLLLWQNRLIRLWPMLSGHSDKIEKDAVTI